MHLDVTIGHEFLNFIDAFLRYNQILMHLDVQKKIVFVIKRWTFYYKVMLFGMENAGATYQCLVNKMFLVILSKTMEVYIDNMLVKSLIVEQYIAHMEQSFKILKRYNMKLNPSKCLFGASLDKFLAYLVTQ